jgi:hypothetical protein
MLPDFERADGEFWGYPESRTFAELLIDRQEDGTLRAVLVGMLREAEGQVLSSRKDGGTMNRLMRPTLLAFVASLVVWGLIAVWDADPRAVSSWLRTWQIIAVDVAVVSGW